MALFQINDFFPKLCYKIRDFYLNGSSVFVCKCGPIEEAIDGLVNFRCGNFYGFSGQRRNPFSKLGLSKLKIFCDVV